MAAIDVIRETKLETAKIEKKTQGLIDAVGDKWESIEIATAVNFVQHYLRHVEKTKANTVQEAELGTNKGLVAGTSWP
jgi:hypothetical protein